MEAMEEWGQSDDRVMQRGLPVLVLLLFHPLPLPVQAVMDPFADPKDESCDVVNPVQQLIFFR